MATYYEILAVDPAAGPDEVRQAYIDRARALHPDRGTGDDRRMQLVNEAYRVLRDPARRSAYDASLRAPAPSVPVDVASDDDDEMLQPMPAGHPFARAFPWLVLAVILGTIFVFTAFAGREKGDPKQELVDHCVALGRGSTLSTVPCAQPNDGRVVLVVERPSHCPDGSEGRSIDDRWLCLAPA